MLARSLATAACLVAALAASARAQVDLSRAQLVPLKNGARLLLVPDSTAMGVEVSTWFDAGVRGDKPGLSGLTRLVQGLMARSEAARQVASEGGVAGSFTTSDLTCFYETLPPGSLERGIEIEATRMKSLAATSADLEAERARARAERRTGADNGPGVHGLQRLYGLLYPGHPYTLPPSGSEADLARITLRQCQDDFKLRFSPERAAVAVVGRFDPAQAQTLARKWIEPLPRRSSGSPAAPALAPMRERRASEPLDFDLRIVFIGWRAPREGDPDALALDLLGRVLSGGQSARLPTQVVGADRNLLFAQAGYDGRREAGLFYVFGALRPGVDSAAVEKDLVDRIGKLATEAVSPEELERARRQAELATLLPWQTVHGRAMAIATADLVDGDFRGAWGRLDRLGQVGAADLQRAAGRVLKADARAVVWLVPSRRAGAPGAGAGR
ncbi:MAG TPA: pitrilysin family protein [Candidatus Eisenbacteria bacterium]